MPVPGPTIARAAGVVEGVTGHAGRDGSEDSVEVKIGIADSNRELVVNSTQSVEDVEKQARAAFESGNPTTLELIDEKGRKYLVPSDKVAYVEIGPADPRKVGFAAL